tara:strand:- start:86 stop:769 length:684 start_codon:yes stop_codon:yes gene_type:complete
MNVIEINGFNFLEVSQSPNIIISLKGDKNFFELDPLAREEFMKKYFGVDSFEDFNQEHGTNIKGISGSEDNAFDGYISSNANCAYAIKTADCIPLILWNEEKQVLSGLHCGWKGLKRGIIPKTIENNPFGSFTHAYIGPHICKAHFEVKEDFIEAFAQENKDISEFIEEQEGKIYMNLRQYTVRELHQYGIEISNNFSPCSYTEIDHFFSWRRDNANPLRNLTIAWF